MPVKEQETNGRMEVCRQEPVSEEEGANTSKTPAKEPPSMPQYSGKKKARRKKKKKKKKKAVQGNGKHPGKSKKQPIFGMSPLRLLQPQSDDVTLQDEATKLYRPVDSLSSLVTLELWCEVTVAGFIEVFQMTLESSGRKKFKKPRGTSSEE